jgi:hypothetical protein
MSVVLFRRFEVVRDRREPLERSLEVRDDVRGNDVGIRKIRRFLERFVLQPEDVEIELVALGELVEEQVVARAGLERNLAKCNATPGRKVDLLVILNGPTRSGELSVDFFAGALSGVGSGIASKELHRSYKRVLFHTIIILHHSPTSRAPPRV